MYAFYNGTLVNTEGVVRGVPGGSYRGTPAVHVKIKMREGEEVEFDLTPDQAHDVGLALISDSWKATRLVLGRMGDTFRKLGFYRQ